MSHCLPAYLRIPPEELGKGQPVKVRVLGDAQALARAMAEEMASCLREARERGRGATLNVPVGPVDQFPLLARLLNEQRLPARDANLREAVLAGTDLAAAVLRDAHLEAVDLSSCDLTHVHTSGVWFQKTP